MRLLEIAVFSVGMFLLFFRLYYKKWEPPELDASEEKDEFQKGAKTTVVTATRRTQWYWGLFYSGAYVLGIPVLIWRYGFWRTFVLESCPLLPMALLLSSQDQVYKFLAFILCLALRGYAGLYVAKNDKKLRCKALSGRGWISRETVF